jgi:hypothetical protein
MRLHPGNVNGVERMEVQDRFNVFSAIGYPIHFILCFAVESEGIQENEFAVPALYQRGLCSDIDQARDFEGTAYIPEIVRYLKYFDTRSPVIRFETWPG